MHRSAPVFKISRSPGQGSKQQPRTIPGSHNCAVHAYPSMGGVVIGYFTGLELEWLGFPRTIAYTGRPSTENDEETVEAENALALRMLQLGAIWWPSRKFEEQNDTRQYPYGYHYPPDRHVGYPSSPSDGAVTPILLLKTYSGRSSLRLPEYDAPEKPEDWSRLAACATMEERCAVLREFGAIEWDDAKKCPDIPQSLEDGMAEGKKYEKLLKDMKDPDYLDKWMTRLWHSKSPGIEDDSDIPEEYRDI